MDKNTLPAVITGSAAFSGALIAQVVSHIFAMKREEKKDKSSIYQHLFAPVIPNIFIFIDSKTHFYGGNKNGKIDEDKIKNDIIEHVSRNLQYCNPKIIAKYNALNKYKYIDDLAGFIKEIRELELFLAILEEYYFLVKKIGILDKGGLNQIIIYQINYLLWICTLEFTNSPQKANQITSYKWMLDTSKYNKKVIKKVKKLIESKKWSDTMKFFSSLTGDLKNKEEFVKIYNQ